MVETCEDLVKRVKMAVKKAKFDLEAGVEQEARLLLEKGLHELESALRTIELAALKQTRAIVQEPRSQLWLLRDQ